MAVDFYTGLTPSKQTQGIREGSRTVVRGLALHDLADVQRLLPHNRRPSMKSHFCSPRLWSLVIAAVLLFVWGVARAQRSNLVAISMPTKSSSRWISDGHSMVERLRARGYITDLQYAEDDVPNQLAQIENMLTRRPRVLVIAAIDGSTLVDVLKKAHAAQVKVIAYDRLIKGSPHVDSYATFDNFQVGVLQAQSLVDKLGLPRAKGPFNIELFGGSPDDNNAFFFYNGALSVLEPYLRSGVLVVRSRQMGMDKVGTLRWDGALAQARMDNLLSAHYGQQRLHGVLSPYDGLSIGILSSLKGVGYCTAQLPCPVVTGQDAEIPSVKSILRHEQSSTVFKDTRALARVAVDMVDAYVAGQNPPVNDTQTYHNGIKTVPAYLLKPQLVDAGNWQALLVDSGYYKASQLK